MVDSSQRKYFVFAVLLHLLILLSFFIRFGAHSAVIATGLGGGEVINAIVVNSQVVNSQNSQNLGQVQQKQVKKELKIEDDLLLEQKKELAELKVEKVKHKKVLAKQEQKILQEQIKREQEEIKEGLKEVSDVKSGAIAGAGQPGIGQSGGVAGQPGEINKYVELIKQAVTAQFTMVSIDNKDAYCKLSIKLAPGGIVLDIKVESVSGDDTGALERAARAAVLKAAPLPVPQDVGLFDEFRVFTLKFNPQQGVI